MDGCSGSAAVFMHSLSASREPCAQGPMMFGLFGSNHPFQHVKATVV